MPISLFARADIPQTFMIHRRKVYRDFIYKFHIKHI